MPGSTDPCKSERGDPMEGVRGRDAVVAAMFGFVTVKALVGVFV